MTVEQSFSSGQFSALPRAFDVVVEAPDEATELGWCTVVGDGGERRAEDGAVRAAVAQGDAVPEGGDPYEETFVRLDDPRPSNVVKHKITVMYGPPMVRPDLALISFQGGGGDRSSSAQIWPKRLVYLEDNFDFGRALRSQCALAGLDETLEKRTVAMAACFPEAPRAQAGLWAAMSAPRAEWRAFSVAWVRKMLAAMSPRAVLIFGMKAKRAMEMQGEWRDEQRDTRNWRAFGRAEVEVCPAIYCQHLSPGWKREHVQLSLREAACRIRGHQRA